MKQLVILFAICLTGLVAGCQKDSSDPVTANRANVAGAEEITDDETGARAGSAVIDKANKMYLVYKVTDICSTTTVSTSVQLAYMSSAEPKIGQYGLMPELPDSEMKAVNGWSFFSVKNDKVNVLFKKSIDKTLNYIFFIRDKDAKVWRYAADYGANEATWQFLPNYYKAGIYMGCGTGGYFELN